MQSHSRHSADVSACTHGRRAISSTRWSRSVFSRAPAIGMRTPRRRDLFLDRQKPSYVGGILEMANHRLYPFWGHLTEALRTGQPQNEVKSGGPGTLRNALRRSGSTEEVSGGDDRHQPRREHDHRAAVSVEGPSHVRRRRHRAGRSGGADRARQSRTCGDGDSTCRKSRRFSRNTSIRSAWASVSRSRPGSFFTDDLPKADVVLMGHILHDWDLPTKKMLIREGVRCAPAGGALIVYEAIIDDDRSKNAFGLMMSLNMLIETPGGFDYTGADCAGWMREAGFSSTRVEPLVGPDSMVVGIK